MGRNFKSGAGCRLAVFTILSLAVSPLSAGVFNVTDANDTYSVASLRGAIMMANQHGGKNTIILGRELRLPPQRRSQPQPWVFHLTISGADEDATRTGDLDITRGDLTIIGATSNVVIDATGMGDRVFQVFTNARLTLQNVTVTGGNSPAGTNNYGLNGVSGDGENGGAIYNAGSLTLNDCVINGNSSGVGGNGIDVFPNGSWNGNGGAGGGIFNAGVLTMNDCVVSGNTGGASGAGGYSVNSQGYAQDSQGNGGDGGGIYNIGRATINACNIFSNLCGKTIHQIDQDNIIISFIIPSFQRVGYRNHGFSIGRPVRLIQCGYASSTVALEWLPS